MISYVDPDKLTGFMKEDNRCLMSFWRSVIRVGAEKEFTSDREKGRKTISFMR